MPGVIQPQRSQGGMNQMLSLGQTAAQLKGAFGGSSQPDPPETDPTQQGSAGNVGDSAQAAQGNAIQRRLNSYNYGTSQNPSYGAPYRAPGS